MNMDEPRRLSRRRILQHTAVVLGSLPGMAILAACGGGAPPAPAPPAAAPTSPPAAALTTAPAAAATTAPAAAPTSAPAAAAKPQSNVQRVTIRDHDWIQGNPGQQGDWYDGLLAKFE